jgi:hypothetical protein
VTSPPQCCPRSEGLEPDEFVQERRQPCQVAIGIAVRSVSALCHADSCAATNAVHATIYSITSSARASSVGGTVRPSILAVSWLMTSSNFDDCTTGSSAGLAPLRMRPA